MKKFYSGNMSGVMFDLDKSTFSIVDVITKDSSPRAVVCTAEVTTNFVPKTDAQLGDPKLVGGRNAALMLISMAGPDATKKRIRWTNELTDDGKVSVEITNME
ncbi:hypothetical protein CIW48_30065 [Methylobacterium sp. P1-11]|uniref:hypothetical protein n=1 Tax=Methylobacterium sp. P1-11 TaxID=2024616 RepID=UPI0011ECDC37|nr:hypothetical protein [Methylobacterium sp. P1-11]KAA0112916.1 hypothetical protein CIW48_30065 [Methylobacterium sp. P1-11]